MLYRFWLVPLDPGVGQQLVPAVIATRVGSATAPAQHAPRTREVCTKGVMAWKGTATVTVMPSFAATVSVKAVTGQTGSYCKQTLTFICEGSIPPCASAVVLLIMSLTVMKHHVLDGQPPAPRAVTC